ncbi:MAG: GxxExxY protein [Gammaproteobacteria bacterium]|nr:MAG: GxxExxY protein [Gammaproteobacteria bacterium]
MNRKGREGSPGVERLCRQVLDAAFTVHTEIGPGMLESTYEQCLAFELTSQGLEVQTQVPLPVIYRGHRLDAGYRIDMLVGGELIVELKAVEKLMPIHQAQLLAYLRLSGKPLGLLINFNTMHLKDGIKRMVNNYDAPS